MSFNEEFEQIRLMRDVWFLIVLNSLDDHGEIRQEPKKFMSKLARKFPPIFVTSGVKDVEADLESSVLGSLDPSKVQISRIVILIFFSLSSLSLSLCLSVFLFFHSIIIYYNII